MMLKKIRLPLLLLTCCLVVVFFLRAADSKTQPAPDVLSTNTPVHLVPRLDDGRIANLAARMLREGHYLHHRLDDEYSEKFFYRYFDALDPQHMHFTQADFAEFDSYRTNLDDLTLAHTDQADTRPAYDIFNRFVQRLEQRTDYADSLLKTEKFEFNTDERMSLDRREAAFPRDLDEARQLWRQRLRAEYLQEKLDLAAASKKSDSAKKGKPSAAAGPSTNTIPRTDAEEMADKLTRRYNRNLRLVKESDNDDVLEIYLTALAHVYDPHSDYMNKSQADNFAISMSLALFGIGAELGSEDGYCVIRKLHPGPAFKSKKVKEGDKIVAVAQGDAAPVDVVDMKLNKAVQLIRGPKGTEVRLTIIPVESPSERRVISLVRDEIKIEDAAAKARIIEFTNAPGKALRLGVIDLPSFYGTVNRAAAPRPETRSTTDDVARLIKKLEQEHVAGIILDLRGNGGGLLEEAIRLTGLFIKEGPVVQVWDGRPNSEVIVDGDPDPDVLYDGPLVVLTSRFSASASEILAGALQDYGRAVVVGDISTHGKGTVQNVNQLSRWIKDMTNDPGELKLTIRKFYRASGASTQLKGVMPDIVLPSVFNYSKDVGETALENPLPWDTIPSARFDKLDLVDPYLSDLLHRSSGRVATNQDFAYVRQDIERFRKDQADKSVSLNEKQRLVEMDEVDARQKAREMERLARKMPGPVVYEIKLADVDKPGLPPPLERTNVTFTANSNPAIAGHMTATGNNTQADEDKAPPVDATLDETERVLADYIALLTKNGAFTVTGQASTPIP